jgi:adenosylmethionine-8-amino-7-oxononanoate aminotransferase
MAVKKYRGIPYHLWNPFTVMEEFLPFLGFGPSVITRGEGPYVYNDRGKRYINGFSSLWNVAIGHGREELVEAAAKQMRELAYASCVRQVHPRAIELAARLVEITSKKYGRVYLATNGSEAIETALKMARQYCQQSPNQEDQGRFKIISLRNSYHGISYGALSTSGLKTDETKFGPLVPGFLQIEPPYCYRCPYGKSGYPECGLECVHALERTIESEGANTIAAFILEPVMAAFGIINPPDEFYRRVGEICHRYGVLFIVDEVTTGFGRTGKLFASEDWDPLPDILCLGKGISSGYLPLAATLATEAIYQRFSGRGNQFEHGSTCSGHPVCSAVGLANISIILEENLPENAAKVGSYLKSRLERLMDRHAIIGDIRGRGLMIGIELVKDRDTREPLSNKKTFNIVLDAATLGLILYFNRNFLALFPPLIINEQIADEILEIINKVLRSGISSNIGRGARLAKEFAVSQALKINRV